MALFILSEKCFYVSHAWQHFEAVCMMRAHVSHFTINLHEFATNWTLMSLLEPQVTGQLPLVLLSILASPTAIKAPLMAIINLPCSLLIDIAENHQQKCL